MRSIKKGDIVHVFGKPLTTYIVCSVYFSFFDWMWKASCITGDILDDCYGPRMPFVNIPLVALIKKF